MHDERFDDQVESPPEITRRHALKCLGAGVTGALGGSLGVSAITTMAAPATPAASAAEADHVRATEDDRLRALVEADMDVAEQLHADDYEVITGGGVVTRGVPGRYRRGRVRL